jgi:hypothetical protein
MARIGNGSGRQGGRAKAARANLGRANLARATMEALEDRRFCDADNSFATATSLGDVYGRKSATSTANVTSDPYDYYKFWVPFGAQKLSVRLSNHFSPNPDLVVYNQSQAQVGASSNAGSTTDLVETTSLNPGTYYYARVAATTGAPTYALDVTTDQAGNSTAAARALGDVSPTPTSSTSDFVGDTDAADYYSFKVLSAGAVNVKLTPFTANANVLVLDAAGTTVASGLNAGTTPENVSKTLTAGTYYLKVLPQAGVPPVPSTNYTVSVTGPAAPPADVGNTVATAKVLGTLGANGSFPLQSNPIGNGDVSDFYKFTTTANGMLNIQIDGLLADANLQLLGSSGNVLRTNTQPGNVGEQIFFGSGPATYYVRVFLNGSASTNYNLRVANAAVPTDAAGNTPGAAKVLTPSAAGLAYANDFIVNKFDHDDFYKVTQTQPGYVRATLSGLTDNLNVAIQDAAGTEFARSSTAGTAGDSIQYFSPTGGTFYIRVFQGAAGVIGSGSAYSLRAGVSVDQAPNPITSARVLTGTAASVSDYVGGNDPWDYYKFTVAAGKKFSVKLSNVTVQTKLYLFNASYIIIGTAVAYPGATGATLGYTAAASVGGVFYVGVTTGTGNNALGSPATPYLLNLSITAA